VIGVVGKQLDLGDGEVSISDTIGKATPDGVRKMRKYKCRSRKAVPGDEVADPLAG
jgi:hypothetical protein